MNKTMSVLIILILIGVCIGFQAFFAGLEIALLSCNRIHVRHLAERKNLYAKWIDQFLSRPVDYLSTTMIGVNLAVVIGAAFSTHLANFFFSEDVAPLVATVCLWPLVLLFGEFIPMSIALASPLRVGLWGVAGLKMAYWIFYPFVRLIAGFSNLITRSLGGQEDLAKPYFTREELRLLFKGVGKDIFNKDDERMIRGIFDFHKIKVREIMVPLKEVVSCGVDTTVGKLKNVVFDSAFSRIPIYRQSPQQIVGTVHAMGLIGMEDDIRVEEVMRTPFKVSPYSTASEVLRKLRSEKRYMAIVVDDQDRAIGIVTVEDILEEIVGDIEDEYDEGKQVE